MMYRLAIALLAVPLGLACALMAGPAAPVKPAPPTPAPAPVPESAQRTLTFQQGFHGYEGTVDLEIWAVAPHTCLEGNPSASSDAYNDGGESQVLMRFDGVFGTGPRQVPPGSTIVAAQLCVSAFDQGNTVHLHRMLVPWKRTATWANMVGGVTADGLEAARQKDSFTFGKISASTSDILFEVRDTVQMWSSGAPNHGWVFVNTGGNGWDFYTSEFEVPRQRPRLTITFIPPDAR